MQITVNDELINTAIQKTGLDAKTLLEKALKNLLESETKNNTLKFPDLNEFRAKIPENKTASATLIREMRNNERY